VFRVLPWDTCFNRTLAFADCERSEQRRLNRLLVALAGQPPEQL
jgi:hypothetical protein